jgi:membrane-associated phospholipid phosphatase
MIARRSVLWTARFRRPTLPRQATLVEAAAVSLVAVSFLLLGRLYELPAVVAIDTAGLALAQQVRSGWLDQLAAVVSSFGAERLWLVAVLGAAALILARRFPAAAALVVVTAGVQPWNSMLKGLYQRARPNEFGSGVQAFSFPSGHAMAAGALYGLLAVLAWRELRGPVRWVAVTVCLTIADLVALSRPYLGLHYPSDVVAGLLAGGLWADVVIIGWRLAASFTAVQPADDRTSTATPSHARESRQLRVE